MGTAVSLRALTLLFSAGWGGSYIYNHADGARDAVTAQLARALRLAASGADSSRGKHDSGGGGGGGASSGDDAAMRALADKMDNLARDVSRAADRPVMYLGQNGNRVSALADALSLAGWGVLALGCGSVVYYVAVWKGWSLKDLAWVSQASFDSTVTSMQQGIARVSGVISTVRREFTERMRVIESRVEAVRTALSSKIETEISEVKSGIGEVSAEVASVHDVLADVTGRIDAIDGKLDTATHGIMALVRVVSSLAPNACPKENPFWELKQLADGENALNKAPLLKDAQPSIRKRISYGIGAVLHKDSGSANGSANGINYATSR